MTNAPRPEAIEAARVLVAGALKGDADSITAALAVPLEAFIVDTHRAVIRALHLIRERGIEAPEVADYLAVIGAGVCGPMELGILAEPAPSANPQARADTLREDYARRLWADGTAAFAARLPALSPDDARIEFDELMGGLGGNDASNLTALSDVEMEPITWLWPGRIAGGKVTIIDGDPGTGKSMVTLDIAARFTACRALPDGAMVREPVPVVLLSYEDGLADTIAPRLAAACANVEIVYALSDRMKGKADTEPITFPRDIALLEREVRRVRAGLVIIDPLMAYLGIDVDSHRDQDIRRVMRGLAGMAERTGAAVVIVRHLNKTAQGNPMYRGGGSIGLIGAARVGLAVGKHPEDDSLRVLASTKSNIGPQPESLQYRIVPCGPTARIEWCGVTDLTAGDILAEPVTVKQIERAKTWLSKLLGKNEVMANDVLDAAKAAGISERTLNRAKDALGVESRRVGKQWAWHMPR